MLMMHMAPSRYPKDLIMIPRMRSLLRFSGHSEWFDIVPCVMHTDPRLRQPIVTGTSVLALKFKDGVMMAADNLGKYTLGLNVCCVSDYKLAASYGSLARFKDVQRLHPVGKYTVIGAGGDMSDFQYIQKFLDELIIEEFTSQDGHDLGPGQIHEYLSQVMYSRRSKINPLWNSLLVGGYKDGQRSFPLEFLFLAPSDATCSFLAYVDLLGTTYSASTLATGYGAYLAQPILRKEVEGRENELTEEEATRIMETCMRVLYYRDARSIDKVHFCTKHKAPNRSLNR